ncbi:MAG TPA: carboxymuconolactone decarboxylase family protein [Steroidobacteraceae bacterium]
MKSRLKIDTVPEAYRAMRGLQAYVDQSGLDPRLSELVKLRASQINGCAYCVSMHVNKARKLGEHEDRLHLLTVWREAPIYTARERAALAWTEAVTTLTDREVPDEVYDGVKAQFSESEIAALTYAIVAINGWNRICLAFRAVPDVLQELIQPDEGDSHVKA